MYCGISKDVTSRVAPQPSDIERFRVSFGSIGVLLLRLMLILCFQYYSLGFGSLVMGLNTTARDRVRVVHYVLVRVSRYCVLLANLADSSVVKESRRSRHDQLA